MVTTVAVGTKIRIAVPFDPTDSRPLSQRRPEQIRETEVTAVDEKENKVHHPEGWVLATRFGIDWDLVSFASVAGNLIVVKTNAGSVIATALNIVGDFVEIYSEAMIPPGQYRLPTRECGKMWDWLKGRELSVVAASLVVVFEPGAQETPKKKRGPKPRSQQAVTAETVELPAESVPVTVSASDTDPVATVKRVFTFRERARLMLCADELAAASESGDGQRIDAAAVEMAKLLREFKAPGVTDVG